MKTIDKNVLDNDKVGHLLFKLSLPAFVGMFVMTVYNVVDTIFIGHFVGPLGIAALSIVFPIQILSMGMGLMMGIGGSSLISRMIGAKDIERAEKAMGNGTSGALILTMIIMAFGLLKTDMLLRIMGASETILPYAKDYLRIILIGMFFQAFAMSSNSFIRAEGNARVPMIGMVIGAFLNVVLDALFIIKFGMGIRGAALATVIGQAITVCYYYLYYYLTNKSYLKIHVKNFIIKWSIIKDILAIGVAAFAMTLSGSISAVFANRLCIYYGGDTAVSVFGIISRIMMFVTMPAVVIGQGLQPIVGFNYGAKHYKRILRVIKIAFACTTIISLVLYIILTLFPEQFISIFTSDHELISAGVHAVRRFFAAVYLIGSIMVMGTTFQSIGRAKESFITSVSRATFFLLPLIFILPKFMQLDGIWTAYPLSDLLTFSLCLVLFIPLIKMFRKLAQGDE